MKTKKSSNFDDHNNHIPNIKTFSFQNNIYGDSSSLSFDENDNFSQYHDIESISYNGAITNYNVDNINQSIKESPDNSINELFIPDFLNAISNNQSFLYHPFSLSDINNNPLNININDEISKNKELLFIITKRIRKTNKNSTKKSERKYDEYNIKNKIQGYYSNSLIELDKSVCKKIGREDLIFYAIKRKYKVENTFIKKNKKNKTI